ncbi:glycosyltransferase family 9 protein [Candidatus Dependentiae bacterium]|nr:glycosyltransferase family 9 protein [Candidatus Dependentiae bacterium]
MQLHSKFNAAYDCIYFKAEKPCIYHKKSGAICKNCIFFKKRGIKILIIKLDAMGDVLRTTSILSPLKKTFPDSSVYWITKSNSLDLLLNNPLIDKVFVYNEKSILYLSSLLFDNIFCFDISPESVFLTSIIKSKKYSGFVWDKLNEIPVPADDKAKYWYSLSINDDYKKNNKLSYQKIILKTAGLNCEKKLGYPIHYYFTENDKIFRELWEKKNKFDTQLYTIGLNTEVGNKWLTKKWKTEYFEKLIKLLKKYDKNINIIVFSNNEFTAKSISKYPKTYMPLKKLTFRNYAVLLSLCDLIVTSDTLAFHLAAALKKKSVCITGPTSKTELENYGKGIILESDKKKCLCCYKIKCGLSPNCMDDIKPEYVFEIIKKMLVEKL